MRNSKLHDSSGILGVRFFNDPLAVGVDGVEANKELIRNQFAAVALCHQLYNFKFPLTQAHLGFVITAVI